MLNNIQLGNPIKIIISGRYSGQSNFEKHFVSKVNKKSFIVDNKKFDIESGREITNQKDCVIYSAKNWSDNDEKVYQQSLLKKRFEKVLKTLNSFNSELSEDFLISLETALTKNS